jgi:hypothetical protein
VTTTDKCPTYDQEFTTRLVTDHPFRIFLRFYVRKVRLTGLKKLIGDHLSAVDKHAGETVLEVSKWDLSKKIEIRCNLTVSSSLTKTDDDLGHLHLTVTWTPSSRAPPTPHWEPKEDKEAKKNRKPDEAAAEIIAAEQAEAEKDVPVELDSVQ